MSYQSFSEEDMRRPVLIHVCKDKTLSYRTRQEPIFNGVAIPVFSVETGEEAEELIRLLGRKQYVEHPLMPGRPWMKITLDGELDFRPHLEFEDLGAVAEKISRTYSLLTTQRRAPASSGLPDETSDLPDASD